MTKVSTKEIQETYIDKHHHPEARAELDKVKRGTRDEASLASAIIDPKLRSPEENEKVQKAIDQRQGNEHRKNKETDKVESGNNPTKTVEGKAGKEPPRVVVDDPDDPDREDEE